MSDLINLKCKSKTGNIIDVQVLEILEIDGQPYQPASGVETLTHLVNHLSGRIAAIEAILGNHTGGN